MIFLIDDKKDRQSKDYDWTLRRLDCFKDHIKPIYSLKQINEENLRNDEGKTILIFQLGVEKKERGSSLVA